MHVAAQHGAQRAEIEIPSSMGSAQLHGGLLREGVVTWSQGCGLNRVAYFLRSTSASEPFDVLGSVSDANVVTHHGYSPNPWYVPVLWAPKPSQHP